jgi:gliding motility-associated-like protein
VNDNFLVNFEVKGEPKIEIVEGKGAMRGNIFTSNLLPNKSTYNFVLKDACATFPVTGTNDCATACTTNAGSMTINANAQTACVTGTVKAIFNNDFKSDGNDSLVFVLHDNPGNVLGEVLGVSKKPLFEFQANLLTDKTYYISPVAGNKDTKTGVNFSDACLSVGKGAPISFKKAPPIPRELRGTAAVCTGQDILIETEKYEAVDAKYRWIIPAANNKEDTITTPLPKYTIKNAQLKNAGSYFVFVETGGCQSTMLGPLDVKVAAVGTGQVKVEKREQHICQAVTQIDLKASAAPSGFSGIWLSLSGATVQAPTQNATKALNLKRGRNDFVWRVSSKECVAGTDTATIIFEFKPQPKPDQFTLDYTELVMDVLKNDSIISPKDVRVTLTKLPAEGTAEMLPNNKIRYTVRSDYEGDVLFTYKVCNTKAMCPDSCATANIGIKVLNVPDLPNFITPNEDGVNDFFPPEEVIANDQLIKLKVLIVNRWGDLVYINENILETQDAWRGDYRGNGKTLPEGAYFYFVEQTYKTKGKQPNKSGAIHLLLKEK